MTMKMAGAIIVQTKVDGGVCSLCGCAIMAGDVLLTFPEIGRSLHQVCCEALEKPPITYEGPIFG